MAEDKEKNSQSADEIVDEMAADMGVEDEDIPEEEGVLGGRSRRHLRRAFLTQAEEEKEKVQEEKLRLLWKRKRKGTQRGPRRALRQRRRRSKRGRSRRVKHVDSKKKRSRPSTVTTERSVGGVFNPKAKDDDVDLMSGGVDDAYLDDDDLGDYGGGGASTSSFVMGGVIVLPCWPSSACWSFSSPTSASACTG